MGLSVPSTSYPMIFHAIPQFSGRVIVIVGLFRFLLLLLFILSGNTSGGRETGAGSDVRDHILDVDALESICEQTGPLRLDIHGDRLQDGQDLLVGTGS